MLIEAFRLAFADANKYICDPQFHEVPVDELLSDSYGKTRARLISMGMSIYRVLNMNILVILSYRTK